MKCYGKATLSDFLGDWIVFRNLNAQDENLPRVEEMRKNLGLADGVLPRKTSMDYARVIAHLLKEAKKTRGEKGQINQIVYLGDTRMNDGTAFRNICAAGGWQGVAFITSETSELTRLEVEKNEDSILIYNNHWVNLRTFRTLAEIKGIEINAGMAVLIDVDKTALGARGRNDAVIDQVRLSAAQVILKELLGELYEEDGFKRAYMTLNQPAFHLFTADNQDYLVYICMVLATGMFTLKQIRSELQKNDPPSFKWFIERVEQQKKNLPGVVRVVHEDIYHLVKQRDPTPFKQFRFAEYQETRSHMGNSLDGASLKKMLKQEIVITREVQEFALECHKVGALVFGLSDKPDEASIPQNGSANLPALHQMQTHVVGG